jgi:hypothetical protein
MLGPFYDASLGFYEPLRPETTDVPWSYAGGTAGAAGTDAGAAGSQLRCMLQTSDGAQAGLQSGMQRPPWQSNPGEQIGVQAGGPAAPPRGADAPDPDWPRNASVAAMYLMCWSTDSERP